MRDHPSRAAVVALPDWRDDVVSPFDVGLMGGAPERMCSYCGSRNFAGERVGEGARAHFTLCCHNGKASALKHRPFPEPPEEFVELLTATNRQGRLSQARTAVKLNSTQFLNSIEHMPVFG